MSSSIPCIRITDAQHEYLVFLTTFNEVERIIRFRQGSRIGTEVKENELPWSARWQLDLELSKL